VTGYFVASPFLAQALQRRKKHQNFVLIRGTQRNGREKVGAEKLAAGALWCG
jgi:hypothetical protein